jgi:hypothetical protein
MAHNVGHIEQLMEEFVGRGIGTSGISQRAVGQAGIQGLSSELATLQQTRANERAQRIRQAAIAANQSFVNAPRANTTAPKQVGPPLGVLSKGMISTGAGSATRGFMLDIPEGGGAGGSKRSFKDLDELMSFFKSDTGKMLKGRILTAGLDISEGAAPSAISSTKQALTFNELRTLGDIVRLTTRSDARQMLGRSAQPEGMAAGLREMAAAGFGRRVSPMQQAESTIKKAL